MALRVLERLADTEGVQDAEIQGWSLELLNPGIQESELLAAPQIQSVA